MSKIAVASAAFVVALIVFVAGSGIAAFQAVYGGSTSSLDCSVDSPSAQAAEYRAEQLANAAIIVAVGKQMNVPEHGQLVAIATAMQESRLRNLDHGDRDSLGLFQQRPSQGWGTPAQIMYPTYAATQFYQHLLATPDWQQMSLNDAAQAVQRSGTPNAYAQHEPAARTVLAAVHRANCTTNTSEVVGTGGCNAIQAPNEAALPESSCLAPHPVPRRATCIQRPPATAWRPRVLRHPRQHPPPRPLRPFPSNHAWRCAIN